jgi:hypothetical protein
MQTIRILLFLSILINSSFARAEISLEESTYCYAVSVALNLTVQSLASVSDEIDRDLKSAELMNEKAIRASEDFQKAHFDTSKQIKKGIESYKNLSISKLVKSGKSLSDAHSILESRHREIIKKQFLFDSKKISWETYHDSLANLYNDCAKKFTNELKKNH